MGRRVRRGASMVVVLGEVNGEGQRSSWKLKLPVAVAELDSPTIGRGRCELGNYLNDHLVDTRTTHAALNIQLGQSFGIDSY